MKVAELRAELGRRAIEIPKGARKPDLERLLAQAEEPLTAESAVERDLAEIAERDPKLARSSHAATALALARELDRKNSATSKSMCARALNETMDRLRELAPEEQTADELDDLARKREQRRARAGAA